MLYIEEEMDGEAVIGAFACESGPDCLKDVVPRFGQRIKVYNAIKKALGVAIMREVCNVFHNKINLCPLSGTAGCDCGATQQ